MLEIKLKKSEFRRKPENREEKQGKIEKGEIKRNLIKKITMKVTIQTEDLIQSNPQFILQKYLKKSTSKEKT
jgi:hypothetical protein